MKQHITVEQLMELTDEQKQRLKEWWKPATNDLIYWDSQGLCRPIGKNNCLPLLSIGQMIELLIQHHGEYWSDSISKINGTTYSKNIYFTYEDELCDCLWQAVKQIL